MTRHQWHAVTALAAMTTLPAAVANAALTASSSGSALDANIVLNGQTLSLPSVGLAAGSAPPAYDVALPAASYSKSAGTSSGSFTVNASAKTVVDTANSKTATTASIMATASSSIGSLSTTLISKTFGTVLTVTGTKIASKASFKLTKAGVGSSAGTTKITKLTINAPLLGINNVTFAGEPSINQVIYQNTGKTITIYLNAQTVTKAGSKETSIKVDAVDVHVANFSVAGNTVSGDIEIGSCIAN